MLVLSLTGMHIIGASVASPVHWRSTRVLSVIISLVRLFGPGGRCAMRKREAGSFAVWFKGDHYLAVYTSLLRVGLFVVYHLSNIVALDILYSGWGLEAYKPEASSPRSRLCAGLNSRRTIDPLTPSVLFSTPLLQDCVLGDAAYLQLKVRSRIETDRAASPSSLSSLHVQVAHIELRSPPQCLAFTY